MIRVTVGGETVEDVVKELLAVAERLSKGGKATKQAEPEKTSPKETPADAPPKTVEKKAAKETAPASTYTLKDVSDKMSSLMDSKVVKKEQVKALLAKFGAKRGGELKEADFGAFIKGATELLASAPAKEEAADEDLM